MNDEMQRKLITALLDKYGRSSFFRTGAAPTKRILLKPVSYTHLDVYKRQAQRLQKEMHKLLLQSASCYDTAGENFYHGFVLGLCAMMDNRYYISSNGESGEGRYDIQLLPKSQDIPGILIELKAGRNFSGDKLKQLSETAYAQIQDRKYDTNMISKGVKTVFKYGVAFSGKQVEVTTNSI